MEHVDVEVGEVFEPGENLAVAQGQALEDAAAELAVGLGHVLSRTLAIFLDGGYHRRWVGEDGVVGVDEALEGRLLHGLGYQVAVGQQGLVGAVGCCLVLPLLAATLVDPHAADVLEESGGALDASLVGEVELVALVVDDGVLGLDAHEAPCARAEVGELLVLGGYGCHSTCGVVSCYGDDWHGLQARHLLHLFRQCADYGGWGCHLAKLFALQAEAFH